MSEEKKELTEQEMKDAAAGYRTRRASNDPINLDARTRHVGGQGGGRTRFAGNQELNDAELGGVDAGKLTRQADQTPETLDARTRRVGGQGGGRTRHAGDQEVTEL